MSDDERRPGLRLHERYAIVRRAALAIEEAADDFAREYDLTYPELLGILCDYQRHLITLLLRTERHPNHPGRKADEAYDDDEDEDDDDEDDDDEDEDGEGESVDPAPSQEGGVDDPGGAG